MEKNKMKDFAKSIKTGNAGDVIHRDGDFKIKYNEKENSYELYFNSIYYDTFHTKEQALDKIELYKRRKEARAGNSKVGNDFSEKEKILMEIKGLKEERAGWIRHKQEHPENKNIDSIIKSYTKDISDLQEKLLKVGNDTPEEYAKRPPKVVCGNRKTGNAQFSVGDKVKLTATGKIGTIVDVGRKTTTQEEIDFYKRNGLGAPNKGDVTEYYSIKFEDGSVHKIFADGGYVKKISNSLPEELEKDVHKKDKEKVEDIDELKKTGNANFETSVEKGKLGLWNWYVHKDGTIVAGGTSATEIEAKSAAEKALKREKVGNARYTTREEEIKSWLRLGNKVGNRQKYDTGDEVTVTLPGRGPRRALVVRDEGNVIKVAFSENGPEVTALPSEVSNKKVGNIKSEYEILKQDPSKMHPIYKKAYEEAIKKLAQEDEEFKKRFEKEYGVKAKNETLDDKFAYVMREFDEGKLKTPDGKVVTDPAQAKAIAYSESKKTENGLARARNAIKK